MLYLERIKRIQERLKEIEKELSSPTAIREQFQYQKLMKEAAQLRPVVHHFEAYQKLKKEAQEVQTAL